MVEDCKPLDICTSVFDFNSPMQVSSNIAFTKQSTATISSWLNLPKPEFA